MKSLKEWVDTDVARLSKLSRREMDEKEFFRQPITPILVDGELVFSPASGVLLYNTLVEKRKDVLDIKGMQYNVSEILEDPEWNRPCWVSSIFMTQFCQHANMIPTEGNVCFKHLEPVHTRNYPMLETENSLLKGIIPQNEVEFVLENERVVNKIYWSEHNYEYFVVQIADSSVDLVTPFSTEQNKHYTQCQRFSFIRYGSQATLILPIDRNLEFEPLLKPLCHVEGGVDALFKVTKKEEKSEKEQKK